MGKLEEMKERLDRLHRRGVVYMPLEDFIDFDESTITRDEIQSIVSRVVIATDEATSTIYLSELESDGFSDRPKIVLKRRPEHGIEFNFVRYVLDSTPFKEQVGILDIPVPASRLQHEIAELIDEYEDERDNLLNFKRIRGI